MEQECMLPLSVKNKKTLIRQSNCPGRFKLSERFFLDHVAEEEGTYIASSNTSSTYNNHVRRMSYDSRDKRKGKQIQHMEKKKKVWFGLKDFPHNRANPQRAICEWRPLWQTRIRTKPKVLLSKEQQLRSFEPAVDFSGLLYLLSSIPFPFLVSFISPCGRNCFVRPPGLSGSQRSAAIPGPSRRLPLALLR